MGGVFLPSLLGLAMTTLSITAAVRWEAVVSKEAVSVRNPAGLEVLRYQLQPPGGLKPAFESGCFFHPARTPAGETLTEVSPPDHPHHRGIFLAWVEMHGEADADFWGWGEHAPTKNRKIVNRSISDLAATDIGAGFHARNEWMAENKRILREDLKASVHLAGDSHIIDLVYTLTPRKALTLTRWAFSGFCVRVPKSGTLTAEGPSGTVNLPNPKHTEPESDWPGADWYNYDLKLPNGATVGAAVIDHPKNPRSLWHNQRDIRMLNPCIVAPAEIRLEGGKPLVLRYRVVLHDGAATPAALNSLAASWRATN